MKLSISRLIFIQLALLLSTTMYAQEDSTNVLKGMNWRNIGPNRGGRSLGISGSPSRKYEYYFGAVGGGLWKTTDGGLNWKPVTDGQLTSSSVGAVGVSPTNPDIIYIGTGETEFRGNIMQGDGVYKSIDGGKTWKNIGLKNTQSIARVRVHPTNPDIVYVTALGHAFGPNEDRGVFKTIDGGKTWKKVLYVNEKAGAEDLVIDPQNPETIYTSIWEVYRTPYKMWADVGNSALYKSTDGGANWKVISKNPGMPKVVGKIGVTVSPVESNRVWAIVESPDGGLYRSDDGGENWKLVNNERKLRQRAFYYSRIVADPKDKNTVYGLNVNFYKSTDGGVSFKTEIKVPHGDNHDLWIDPTDPMRMATSNDGGGSVSINGGLSWTDEDFPTAQLYHITTTSDFPYQVAAAQQDNSTITLPSEDYRHRAVRTNSTKPGIGFAYDAGGGESGYITQDPKNPDIFYAGSQGALLTRINRMTGQVRDVQVYPRFFSGEEAKTLPERWQWTYPIVFSPVDPKVLFTCSQHVWKTTNEGQSWEQISPDLTYNDSTTLGVSGGVITRDMNGPEIYGTVFALAPSYQDVNIIWAGSDDGLIHITKDGGKHWDNITPKDMPKNTRVSIIEASRFNAGTAYVAAKRYQMDDRSPYIWKTTDFGASWKKIITGIRADDYIHAVREDITRAGLLYAGSEHGIWVSYNDGEHWESLRLNLPDLQVSDVAVTEKDIVIATHGRSIYVLDDISPVRTKDKGIQAGLHLFQPYYAVRNVQRAVFQYYLDKDIKDLKIEILNKEGNIVQSFIGVLPKEKKDSALLDEDEDDRKPVAPSIKPGLNSFEWDLKYPGATYFKGMIFWSAPVYTGPLAVPGSYQVRMTAGGKSQTVPFEIKQDPRANDVTLADMEEKFKLSIQIRDEVSKANDAVIKIRALKEKLKTELSTAKSKRRNEINMFVQQISTIEENLYQVKNQSSQDPLNFPIKLNNKLAALMRVVESGDYKPTAGSYKVFEELKAELATELNHLDLLLLSPKKG
jgi:photosystem II stability/assembly factor-like uncharacterized protein